MRVSSRMRTCWSPRWFPRSFHSGDPGKIGQRSTGFANLSLIKGRPAVCTAPLPQISVLLCLCLKLHLSKKFATQQVSLQTPIFVWGSFFPLVSVLPVNGKFRSLWGHSCRCFVVTFVSLAVCILPQPWEGAVGVQASELLCSWTREGLEYRFGFLLGKMNKRA